MPGHEGVGGGGVEGILVLGGEGEGEDGLGVGTGDVSRGPLVWDRGGVGGGGGGWGLGPDTNVSAFVAREDGERALFTA